MSSTKSKKMKEANMLLESRYTDRNKHNFEDEDPTLEDPTNFDFDDYETDDYGLDYEDETETEYDENQKDIKFKNFLKNNKVSSVGIGDSVRWDRESEKEYSPIKPSDIPLEKYLELKNKKKIDTRPPDL